MLNTEGYGNYGSSVQTEEEIYSQTQQISQAESFEQENFDVNQATYDDYSVTPNYSEEKSYNSKTTNFDEINESEVTSIRSINLPTIQREEKETVSLLKTKQRIILSPRMKIVVSAFSIIMVALFFLICFNFASLGGLNATARDREITINELNQSISELQQKYNLAYDDEQILIRATEAGYVNTDETNTFVVEYEDFYQEKTIEDLPSNWFNDICNFFSNLFS